MTSARLSLTMKDTTLRERVDVPEARPAAADRLALWLVLGLGLLLMLVSAARAEQAPATRVDRFNGTLAAGQTIHVENITGDVIAAPGAQFSAVVTVSVTAATPQRAADILRKIQIRSSHDDDGWSLETMIPGAHSGRRGDSDGGSPCGQCRITARYELVVPPGVTAELQTVNGDVRVHDLDGDLDLQSVNGSIEARGARHGISLQTVNGHIEAVAQTLPADSEVSLQSVNGNVTLTLPKDARFEFAASTMNGTIASTFPLPAQPPAKVWWVTKGAGKAEGKGKSKSKDGSADIVVEDEDGNRQEIDLEELNHQLAESMRQVEIQVERGMRDAEKNMREVERQLRDIEIPNPQREYSGSIGKGGPDVHMETLNGRILLLAAGTKEADARPLVSERRSVVVTVPPVHVHVPPVAAAPAPAAPPVPPPPPASRAPRAAPPAPLGEGDIVRGDVGGDFLSTSGGDYHIGKVSGRVKILSQSGEIRVGGAGGGAELKTYGGDIVVGPVTGDLKASTLAGDIVVESVSGSALADTNGGDIRIDRVGGNLDVRTSGGDIRVQRVGGGVRAASAGGEIRIGLSACDARGGGVTIRNDGGDVTLALPADCKAEVELVVTGADEDETAVRSDFPESTLSRRNGVQRSTLTLNGGGEKILVRTTSGTIRLRRGSL